MPLHLPLIATWLEASLGLTQGPALYCLIWAVPTLLAYRQLERHLLPDPEGGRRIEDRGRLRRSPRD